MMYKAQAPVEPDRDQAHDWLWTELQKAEYSERESLLQRGIREFLEWLNSLETPDVAASNTQLAIGLVVALIVIVGVAWFVAGPVRRERRIKRSAGTVLEKDDVRTAAQMRASADVAARRNDWTTAVVERFRAIVRSCEERVIIEPLPGRTAQEAVRSIAERLPAQDAQLHHGAVLFDQVEYGEGAASASDDHAMRALDEAVTSSRIERSLRNRYSGGASTDQPNAGDPQKVEVS